MNNSKLWSDVDTYFGDKLIPSDSILEEVLANNRKADLPEIEVSPAQGKFLYMLAKIKGVKHILEIGTLGGYSTIWLASAITDSGKVYSLEADPKHAEVAQENISKAGFENKVEIMTGKALDSLPVLKERAPIFDLVFIDADKQNNPHYLEWALELTQSGSVIITDNVVRKGKVIHDDTKDDRIEGVRNLVDMLEKDPRIDSVAMQTVGIKGYDGFIISIVK